MKLAHPQLENTLELSGEKAMTLVIENQSFFREFLQDIRFQIDGYAGKTVLSDKKGTLDWTKRGEILDSYLSITLNRKPLLTKIAAAMEAEAMGEGFYVRTAQLLSQIEQYLGELAFAMDCDVTTGCCSVSGLLKTAGVTLREDYENPLEQLIDYMELVRSYEREKAFVFVNLRSYFPDGQISSFLRTAKNHGYAILLVDNQEYPRLPEEERLVIDKDLCEI